MRSGEHVVESRHYGHVVVRRPGPDAHLGDAAQITFIRSAAKPFQATVSLELLDDAGVGPLTHEELAVGWASHRGEERHLAAVRSLLSRAGLSEADLTCPPATPAGAPGAPPSRIAHNCSGKHALFALAGAQVDVRGEDLLDPEGRLQTAVLGHLHEVLGPPAAVGVDGCGAPAVAVPLSSLATGFQRLVSESRHRRVIGAGTTRPGHVGGEGRLETALLGAGVIAKPGAEAVFGAAWLDAGGAPWSISLKIDDGGSRAAPVVLHSILSRLGVVREDLWSPDPVQGGGRPVGVVRPSPGLREFAGALAEG